MEVYPERMLKNIYLTKGLIFSQALLLALVKKGLPRQKAYEMIQDCAMRVWQGEQDLKTQVLSHKEIKVYLTPAEIEKIFDLKYCLRHIDKIFARIF